MPITYTWADNADDTGLTVTIAGGAAADSHRVFYQSFSGDVSQGAAWTTGSLRVGDGTIVEGVAAGMWLVYVSSLIDATGATKFSSVAYQVATTGTGSVHYQCLGAVQSKIQALGLSGIDNSSIVVRKLPTDRGGSALVSGITYPAIVISHLGVESQPETAGTNNRDDVDYPVMVQILAADNQTITTDGTELKWREQINRAFRNQRLAGVDEIYKVKVQPGPIISPVAFWANRYQGSMILRCVSREVRGT